MGTLQIGFAGFVFLYVLSFATGFWLSVSGRPLKGGILTLHKLTALMAIALIVYAVYQSVPAAGLSGVDMLAITMTVLLFVGAIATGALLSIQKPMPAIVKSLHLLLPVASALGTCVTILLLVMP